MAATLDELIDGLRGKTLHDDKTVIKQDVIDLMTSYSGDDWKQYAFWDDHCYTRNRIYLDPNDQFELVIICWNISQYTPIHNHPDSQCFYKLLQGSLTERSYAFPTAKRQPMKVIGEERLEKLGTTGYIDDGMGIHMVENESPSEGCVTLHLYTPAYKDVDCFDERTGKRTTHKGHNYSIRGVKCTNE